MPVAVSMVGAIQNGASLRPSSGLKSGNDVLVVPQVFGFCITGHDPQPPPQARSEPVADRDPSFDCSQPAN
jgi:hypothetical protein